MINDEKDGLYMVIGCLLLITLFLGLGYITTKLGGKEPQQINYSQQ